MSTDAADLRQIEMAAEDHRHALDRLRDVLAQLNDAIEEAKRTNLPMIRRQVAATKASRHLLAEMVRDHPHLFQRPKTREMHGIRVGYRKGRDRVLWPEEAELVRRVRAVLGPKTARALIEVRERVNRAAVTPDIRAQLDIAVAKGDDQLLVEPLDGEVDKLIGALLGDLVKELETETNPHA